MQRTQQVYILKTLLEQLETGRNIAAGGQMRVPASSHICPDIAEPALHHFHSSCHEQLGLPPLERVTS